MKGNKHIIATITCLGLFLSGCDKEHVVDLPSDQKDMPVVINATTSLTKAPNMSTSFLEGNHIGIYVLTHIDGETPDSARFRNSVIANYSNVGYTLTSSSWEPNPEPPQPTIIVPNPSKQIYLDYYVYYPYTGDIIQSPITSLDDPTAIRFTLPADQTLEATLNECDLMVANKITYNNKLDLQFVRQCALLQFVFQRGEGWQTNDIVVVQQISINGNKVYYDGKMDIRGINLITPENNTTALNKTIYRTCNVEVPETGASTNSDYLIIPPMAAGDNQTDIIITFQIAYEANTYTYTAAMPLKTFEKGKHYTYKIVLKYPSFTNTVLNVTPVVTPWVTRSWIATFT